MDQLLSGILQIINWNSALSCLGSFCRQGLSHGPAPFCCHFSYDFWGRERFGWPLNKIPCYQAWGMWTLSLAEPWNMHCAPFALWGAIVLLLPLDLETLLAAPSPGIFLTLEKQHAFCWECQKYCLINLVLKNVTVLNVQKTQRICQSMSTSVSPLSSSSLQTAALPTPLLESRGWSHHSNPPAFFHSPPPCIAHWSSHISL